MTQLGGTHHSMKGAHLTRHSVRQWNGRVRIHCTCCADERSDNNKTHTLSFSFSSTLLESSSAYGAGGDVCVCVRVNFRSIEPRTRVQQKPDTPSFIKRPNWRKKRERCACRRVECFSPSLSSWLPSTAPFTWLLQCYSSSPSLSPSTDVG